PVLKNERLVKDLVSVPDRGSVGNVRDIFVNVQVVVVPVLEERRNRQTLEPRQCRSDPQSLHDPVGRVQSRGHLGHFASTTSKAITRVYASRSEADVMYTSYTPGNGGATASEEMPSVGCAIRCLVFHAPGAT